MPKIKLYLHLGQWHVRVIAYRNSTKLDSIQLGPWISRYAFTNEKNTLSKIKYHE
jgi:hypothetical protein